MDENIDSKEIIGSNILLRCENCGEILVEFNEYQLCPECLKEFKKGLKEE